jgi:peptide/nickel transport system substrate-binding protein
MRTCAISKKIRRIAALIMIMCMLFVGCGSNQSTESNAGNTGNTSGTKVLTMGTTTGWTTLYPFAQGQGITNSIRYILYSTLVWWDENNNPQPLLAESWETEDDGYTYVVHLNQNAKWSDGEPITSADIEFSWNLLTNPELEVGSRSQASQLVGTDDGGNLVEGEEFGIEIVDDYTIKYHLKNAINEKCFFSDSYQCTTFPKHCLEDADLATLSDHEYWKNPVTSGSFLYDSEVEGESITMKANKDYFMGAPQFDMLVIKVVDSANMLSCLINGEIDVTVGNSSGALPAADYETAKKYDYISVNEINSGSILHMPINTTKEYFQDKRVRQAFDYAVNRQRIVDNVLYGHGCTVSSFYNTYTCPYIDPSLEIEYDPDKAKQLLQEAGWDFDRVIEICQPTGNELREQAALYVQQDLEAIGVKTTITTVDYNTQMAMLSENKLDIAFMGGSTDPKNVYFMFSCYNPAVAYNWSHWPENNFIDLLNEILKTSDEDQLKTYFTEFQEMQNDLVPEVWICNEYELIAYNSDKISEIQIPPSTNTCWTPWQWEVSGV